MTTEAKPKKIKLVTPTGEAKWAHVHTPYQIMQHGKPKGDPQYCIVVIFDAKDPAWELWAKKVMDEYRALPIQFEDDPENPGKQRSMSKRPLIKRELDEDDKPTGRFFVSFKTGAQYPPGLLDKYGREIPESILIGNGSKVKVSYTPSTYKAFGGGINFYLNGVQVIDLVEYNQRDAKSLGFQCETPPPDAPAPGEESQTVPETEDSSIPF